MKSASASSEKDRSKGCILFLLGFLITAPAINLLDECHEVARFGKVATRRKSEDSSHGLESPKHLPPREQRYAEGQMLVLSTKFTEDTVET